MAAPGLVRTLQGRGLMVRKLDGCHWGLLGVAAQAWEAQWLPESPPIGPGWCHPN